MVTPLVKCWLLNKVLYSPSNFAEMQSGSCWALHFRCLSQNNKTIILIKKNIHTVKDSFAAYTKLYTLSFCEQRGKENLKTNPIGHNKIRGRGILA